MSKLGRSATISGCVSRSLLCPHPKSPKVQRGLDFQALSRPAGQWPVSLLTPILGHLLLEGWGGTSSLKC